MTISGNYKDDVYFQNDPWKWIKEQLIPLINGSGGTGIEPSSFSTNQQLGFIPIDIFGARAIVSDVITDETIVSTGGSEKAPGGILAADGAIFSIQRVNGGTDNQTRIIAKANTTGELALPTIMLPHDLDDSADMTFYLLAGMGGATDTPTIDCQAFFGVGDTECGGATSALAATVAAKSVTLAADDVVAYPNTLSIALVPGAHANDAIWIYGAWLTYTKKA